MSGIVLACSASLLFNLDLRAFGASEVEAGWTGLPVFVAPMIDPDGDYLGGRTGGAPSLTRFSFLVHLTLIA